MERLQKVIKQVSENYRSLERALISIEEELAKVPSNQNMTGIDHQNLLGKITKALNAG